VGVTFVNVVIKKSAHARGGESVERLVDSGAHYSAIPRPTLKRLGTRPTGKESFIQADGSKIERELAAACFEFEGRLAPSTVICGEEGDATLLGVVTLEELGLMLEPLKRELRRLPLRMM
jgi:predicted aspartyl protease